MASKLLSQSRRLNKLRKRAGLGGEGGGGLGLLIRAGGLKNFLKKNKRWGDAY